MPYSAYLTGHPTIDEGSTKILCVVEGIRESISTNTITTSKIKSSLSTLLDLLTEHYKVEETLMRKSNYPNYRDHVYTHTVAKAKIEHLLSEYRNNPVEAPSILVVSQVLSELIVDYIAGSDFLAAQYIIRDEMYAKTRSPFCRFIRKITNWIL